MSSDHADEQRARMGARLRAAREYLGFSQDEVATSLGLSRPAVTNMESGARKIEALELEKLAQLYGCGVAYLLSGDEPAAPDEQIAFAARALRGLSGRDLEEVSRFASYLRNSSRASARKGKP